MFQYLVDNGADIEIKTNSGKSLLEHSIRQGNEKLIECLELKLKYKKQQTSYFARWPIIIIIQIFIFVLYVDPNEDSFFRKMFLLFLGGQLFHKLMEKRMIRLEIRNLSS